MVVPVAVWWATGPVAMNTSGYRYKQNRFQQLRGFCYAASSGSISKAAKRMYLSQPAVSQQIQGLENELAATLFSRRGSRIQLTHEGELLFQMARPLIEELEDLDEKFRQRRAEVDEGHIEIAAGTSTILYFLPKHVEAFRRAHPKIELRLQNVTGIEGLERLRSGLVDFAVGPLMGVPADIEFHPIVSYDPVVITCLGHPLANQKKLTLQAISRYPLILPPRNLSTSPMVDSTFKKHGLSYQVTMEVGGWEGIKKYVDARFGYFHHHQHRHLGRGAAGGYPGPDGSFPAAPTVWCCSRAGSSRRKPGALSVCSSGPPRRTQLLRAPIAVQNQSSPRQKAVDSLWY